jgi:DNA-binding XRE family transcriptional regulator
VGYDILTRREATGLPRTPVADKIGISERTLFRWEMEGTHMANRERVISALNSMHYTPSGRTNVARVDDAELRKASSVALASELLERAKIFDNYTRMVEDLKDRMNKDGLGHYLPPGI